MGYLGQKYDKGLVIQRSPEGSAFQENADVTVDGDTEITPKVGGGFKKVNITGGGGGAAKRVELMDDIDLNDEWDTLDLEGLGIPDFSMTDLDEGKVKFTFNSMDLEFIGRGSVLSNEYYWVPTFEDPADEYAVLQLFNRTTFDTLTIVLAFTNNVVEACGHEETDHSAQTDLVVTINPLNSNDVTIETNTWLADDIESVEELYHKMVHYREKFITFAWTNIINESLAFYKGEVEGIVYNRESDELRIEINCDGVLFKITIYKDPETGNITYSWYNEDNNFTPNYGLYLGLDLNDDTYLDLDFSVLDHILQYMWGIGETELWFGEVGYHIVNGENAPIVSSSDAKLHVQINYDQHTVNLHLNTSRGGVIINIMPGQQEGDYAFQVNWDYFEKPNNSSTPISLYVENSMKRAVPVVKFIDYLSGTGIHNTDEFYALVQEAYAGYKEEHADDRHEFNLPTYFILNSAQPINLNAIKELTGKTDVWIRLFSEDDNYSNPEAGQSSITYTTEGSPRRSENYITVTDFDEAEGIVIVFYYGGE